MFGKTITALGALLLSAAALAQAVVGAVTGVQGLVTVSTASTVANAVPGSPVADGNRYVTGSNGTLTLKMNNGCEVTLKPNQSLVIAGNVTCEALLAMIQP